MDWMQKINGVIASLLNVQTMETVHNGYFVLNASFDAHFQF